MREITRSPRLTTAPPAASGSASKVASRGSDNSSPSCSGLLRERSTQKAWAPTGRAATIKSVSVWVFAKNALSSIATPVTEAFDDSGVNPIGPTCTPPCRTEEIRSGTSGFAGANALSRWRSSRSTAAWSFPVERVHSGTELSATAVPPSGASTTAARSSRRRTMRFGRSHSGRSIPRFASADRRASVSESSVKAVLESAIASGEERGIGASPVSEPSGAVRGAKAPGRALDGCVMDAPAVEVATRNPNDNVNAAAAARAERRELDCVTAVMMSEALRFPRS